jgi:hypothetical protein
MKTYIQIYIYTYAPVDSTLNVEESKAETVKPYSPFLNERSGI